MLDPDPYHLLTLRIRIRILLFRQWLTRCKQKKFISKFCLLLFKGIFTSVFKGKKFIEIKVFLLFQLVNGRIRIRIHNTAFLFAVPKEDTHVYECQTVHHIKSESTVHKPPPHKKIGRTCTNCTFPPAMVHCQLEVKDIQLYRRSAAVFFSYRI